MLAYSRSRIELQDRERFPRRDNKDEIFYWQIRFGFESKYCTDARSDVLD